MTEHLTLSQFVEVLEHNKGNDRDTDIWVLNEDGSTAIVPDQNIDELKSRNSWPMYICRAAAVNSHVAADGPYAALEYLNWAISVTVVAASPREILAFAVKSGYRAILAGLGRDT